MTFLGNPLNPCTQKPILFTGVRRRKAVAMPFSIAIVNGAITQSLSSASSSFCIDEWLDDGCYQGRACRVGNIVWENTKIEALCMLQSKSFLKYAK